MIIVQYKLGEVGGSNEHNGGEPKVHVFSDLTELKSVLKNKYYWWEYSINDLMVFNHNNNQDGGVLNYDLEDEIISLMRK